MAGNKNLAKAKSAKKDEFYTSLNDVENEMCRYEKHFEGKTVFCNCDDPYESSFWFYFHKRFKSLGLKKLVATHYNERGKSFKLEYMGGDDNNIYSGVKTELNNDGDFRSEECIELLKEADIVVTNPPFSLFREFMALLVEHDKDFIVWGNVNAVTYKEIFPLIKEEKVWFGYLVNKTCYFKIPDHYDKWDEKYTEKMNDGNKYAKVPSITVFTNLDIPKRHQPLDLVFYYEDEPEKYPKYENYDVIEISKVKDIPADYEGVMGVPITFFGKYCPEQFEIIGIACGNSWANYTKTLKALSFNPNIKYGGGLGSGIVNGKAKYARILIRNKNSRTKKEVLGL